MATVVPFAPTLAQPFQFQPTLDNQVYTCVVLWNVAGQRYYLNCYTLAGTLVFSRAMVGSPPDYDISLAAGYFSTVLVYRQASNQFEVF